MPPDRVGDASAEDAGAQPCVTHAAGGWGRAQAIAGHEGDHDALPTVGLPFSAWLAHVVHRDEDSLRQREEVDDRRLGLDGLEVDELVLAQPVDLDRRDFVVHEK